MSNYNYRPNPEAIANLPKYMETKPQLNMATFYRISDKGYAKQKLNVTKEDCLNSYIKTFGINGLVIIADNCEQSTVEMVKSKGIKDIHEIQEGNAGSFRYAMNLVTKMPDKNTIVYFLEDDYLHVNLPNLPYILADGFTVGADYVTLYDCPDKYSSHPTPNPYVDGGGETTKVIVGKHCHYKLTNSTTMTFASTVKTINEDFLIWRKYIISDHPKDFDAWIDLREQGRALVSTIPGFATHTELNWLGPVIPWDKVIV